MSQHQAVLLVCMNTFNGEKIKYFIYARKSQENEERQVQSIPDQLEDLNKLSAKLNIEIKAVFTEAKSAKAPYTRPVFQEMVKRIEKGEANGILVWHTNRLFRNPVDLGTIQWMLQQGIIKCIRTLDRQFLPTDSVILLSIEGSMANQYIIDLRNACFRGMESKARKGWLPSLPPAGYLTNRNDRNVIVDPDRFDLIRKMWDMMISGKYSPEKICEIANTKWGYRTRKTKRQGGTELSVSALYHIFHNIFYTGMFVWGKKQYLGNHKPMITLDEFERVQSMLNNNGALKAQKHEFTFTGFIKCSQCEGGITATRKRKWVDRIDGFRHYDYYHCTKKKKHITCTQEPLQEKELEDQIMCVLEKFNIPENFGEIANEVIQKERDKELQDINVSSEMLTTSIAKLKGELENLNRMRYKEFVDDDFYVSEKEKLNSEMMGLNHRLIHIKDYQLKAREDAAKALLFAINITGLFKSGSVEDKKHIVRVIGSNFRLKGKKLIFDKAEWLCIVENGCPPIKAAKMRLELVESPYCIRAKEAICTMYSNLVHLFERCSNFSDMPEEQL